MHGSLRCFCVLAVVSTIGCGGGGKSPTVPVTGVVTHNGSPVQGATVVFGAASDQSHSATGITDAEGRFSLSTYDRNDGAVVGDYQVAITKTETSGGMSEDEEHAALTAGREVPETRSVSKLPAKYGNASTSNLTAQVTAGAPNEFNFDLTD